MKEGGSMSVMCMSAGTMSVGGINHLALLLMSGTRPFDQ
ncbi:hypothetical protein LRHMDP2_4 [Lacticaseibacillus rhamnosus LRHMDP2]|uniref:Uncharacterized protein n=1 Tax=Lacticaseibacillus rhamnosus LRHMDP3 TaxID=1203259 RepID=A0AB33XSA8_LACRH|nr:hypothetical protein LRHMDP3_2282 [Lacticaseibacillus rhamnosus LRHMDP3]EKS53763.1 hypothetical protein LRHMDP2_4 [Lacticaseibacillus rhamnosus LRHMDP2]